MKGTFGSLRSLVPRVENVKERVDGADEFYCSAAAPKLRIGLPNIVKKLQGICNGGTQCLDSQ